MSESDGLPSERSVARLRYLNTPTSNWAADRIEAAKELHGAAMDYLDGTCTAETLQRAIEDYEDARDDIDGVTD